MARSSAAREHCGPAIVSIIQIGHVREIVRYPVKSMAGIATASALLGWHGLEGDRRFAFRRVEDRSNFPWLSASRLPELLLYQPGSPEEKPTRVVTPAGSSLELGSDELNAEITERFGSQVELMQLKHGIFDEADVSIISLTTIAGIGREAGLELDRRRFRANIVLEPERKDPFLEDEWVGRKLVFGNGEARPAVNVTMRDLRCVMINLDPDTAEQDLRVMKTAVRLNDNNAGVYGSVVQTGTIHVGDRVSLLP